MKDAKLANQFILGNITAEDLMNNITAKEVDYITSLIDDIMNETDVFTVLWNWAFATLKLRNALIAR